MPTDHPLQIVFTGGGTGGHLFPGLAVAERLKEEMPDLRITFAGTGRDFERGLVTEAGFEYVTIPCRPFPRRFRDAWPFLTENFSGYRAAKRFLREHQTAAVIGLGGYASVPTARAAVRAGIPLVLLEQNAIPGKATRWLAHSATVVCTAFDETRQRLRTRCPVVETGNPIRSGFDRRSLRRDEDPKQLVILGGSSGARTLNEAVPQGLQRVQSALAGWRILHQTGPADWEATRERYAGLNLNAEVVPFVRDMAGLLSQTDLAVSRAGGTTLAELAAAGVPAILVPYPHAADDHQRRNADAYAGVQACLILDERRLNGSLAVHLADTLAGLLAEPSRLPSMSASMRRLALPHAAAEVAAVIRGVIVERGQGTGTRGQGLGIRGRAGATLRTAQRCG